MGQLLSWWLMIEGMGLIGLPLAFRIFSARTDYGYPFAKVFTLLAISWVAWLAANAGVAYSTSLVAAAVLFAVVNAAVLAANRAEIGGWLRQGGLRAVLLHDGLWTLGFLFFAWQRSYAPEIGSTEKFMDFAFFNTLARTDVMPPQDPWMSGEIFNYYYFGYLMMANLARLAPMATEFAYNCCVATLGGLAFSQAAALGISLTRSLSFGALSGVATIVIGNLDGLLQWMEKRSLTGFDYFRSSRIVADGDTINEFPFFTVIHGDLHPHFIVMPVAILLWALLADPGRKRPAGLSSYADLWFYLPLAFVLASSVVISPWELPVSGMMTFLLLQRDLPLWPLVSWPRVRAAVASGVLLAIGYLMYLPFYLHFEAPDGGVGFKLATTSIKEFLVVFAFLLSMPALLVGVEATRRLPRGEVAHAVLALGSLALVIAAIYGKSVMLLLALLIGATLVSAYREDDEERRGPLLMALGGMVLLLACELVYIRDPYGERLYRMNTVFKFYLQAWILLSLAGPWCWQQLLERTQASATVRTLAKAVVGALLLASCVYPLGVTMTRATHQFLPMTLDGNEYLRREHPNEYAAVQWMRANVQGMPVVLEATGNPYSYYARFASNVGVPTVMGWANHEGLWRNHESLVGQRVNDVKRMYTSKQIEEIVPLLDQYQVKYVVVGELERKDYPSDGLAKFSGLKVAFQSGNVIIYER